MGYVRLDPPWMISKHLNWSRAHLKVSINAEKQVATT